MTASARQTVTDYSENLAGRVSCPSSYMHTALAPLIRPIAEPLNSDLTGITVEVFKPQSWRVPKVNRAFFISPTWSICGTLASKAVTTQFAPNEGVTTKTVRQCVGRDFEKSPTRCQKRSICPMSLKRDAFLTHNFPPNGRYSSCLPFLLSL